MSGQRFSDEDEVIESDRLVGIAVAVVIERAARSADTESAEALYVERAAIRYAVVDYSHAVNVNDVFNGTFGRAVERYRPTLPVIGDLGKNVSAVALTRTADLDLNDIFSDADGEAVCAVYVARTEEHERVSRFCSRYSVDIVVESVFPDICAVDEHGNGEAVGAERGCQLDGSLFLVSREVLVALVLGAVDDISVFASIEHVRSVLNFVGYVAVVKVDIRFGRVGERREFCRRIALVFERERSRGYVRALGDGDRLGCVEGFHYARGNGEGIGAVAVVILVRIPFAELCALNDCREVALAVNAYGEHVVVADLVLLPRGNAGYVEVDSLERVVLDGEFSGCAIVGIGGSHAVFELPYFVRGDRKREVVGVGRLGDIRSDFRTEGHVGYVGGSAVLTINRYADLLRIAVGRDVVVVESDIVGVERVLCVRFVRPRNHIEHFAERVSAGSADEFVDAYRLIGVAAAGAVAVEFAARGADTDRIIILNIERQVGSEVDRVGRDFFRVDVQRVGKFVGGFSVNRESPTLPAVGDKIEHCGVRVTLAVGQSYENVIAARLQREADGAVDVARAEEYERITERSFVLEVVLNVGAVDNSGHYEAVGAEGRVEFDGRFSHVGGVVTVVGGAGAVLDEFSRTAGYGRGGGACRRLCRTVEVEVSDEFVYVKFRGVDVDIFDGEVCSYAFCKREMRFFAAFELFSVLSRNGHGISAVAVVGEGIGRDTGDGESSAGREFSVGGEVRRSHRVDVSRLNRGFVRAVVALEEHYVGYFYSAEHEAVGFGKAEERFLRVDVARAVAVDFAVCGSEEFPLIASRVFRVAAAVVDTVEHRYLRFLFFGGCAERSPRNEDFALPAVNARVVVGNGLVEFAAVLNRTRDFCREVRLSVRIFRVRVRSVAE